MSAFANIPGPICNKCQQQMKWVSEQLVDSTTMQVFHCEGCDKYAAAKSRTIGVKTAVAPSLAPGL